MTGNRLRICINLYPIAPGGAGGLETICRWIVDIPQRIRTGHEFEVLLHPSQGRWSERLEHGRPVDPFRPPAQSPRISLARRALRHRLFPDSARHVLRFVLKGWRPFRLDRVRRKAWIESRGFDVVHCPYQTIDPLPPDHARIPYCINLHDLQHEHFPRFFSRMEIRSRRRRYAESARLARAIFVIADHIKADVVHYCRVRPEKVHVVWPGPPFEGWPQITEEQRMAVRRRYGLPERFFFYPAVTWEHKNHVRLLRAVRLVLERRDYGVNLVFSGREGPHHREVVAEVSRLGLEGHVIWLGFIPYEDVHVLYSLADATVVPTLYEASSGPVMEALSMGCPVACSTAANLPWVVQDGEAGLLFDARDVESIAEALGRLWEDEELRRRLAVKGLVRSKAFSWTSFAEGYLRVYEQIAAGDRT